MRFEEILVYATMLIGSVPAIYYGWSCYRPAWLGPRPKPSQLPLKARAWMWARAMVLLAPVPPAENDEPVLVEYCRAFFPVLLLVLVLRSFVMEPYRIPSSSMKPTLLIGDFIVVNKHAYGVRLPISGHLVIPWGTPQRGDVVVFRQGASKDVIKRVIGLPGDKITYRDKQLWINDEPIPLVDQGTAVVEGRTLQQYQETIDQRTHTIYHDPQRDLSPYFRFAEAVVPPDHYFVMGDNRDNSDDSRFWGFVQERAILGQAFATWLSWDSEHTDVRWRRMGRAIE